MSTTLQADHAYRRVIGLGALLFLSYLAIAMPLPAVPVYVVHRLGLNSAWAGLAVGIAFLSTILTRGYAGSFADRLGGKLCMLRGLLVYALASLVCLISAWPGLPMPASYTVLICGRLLLGLGESLALVGMLSWGFGLMGPARSGSVLALVGMCLYAAFALGGPLGLMLLSHFGFGGLMGICVALPLLGLLAALKLPGVEPHAGKRESFWRVIGRIWRPGATVCLQGVGFAAIATFISLYFLTRGWPYGGLGLTFFGVGFVAVRLLCGHLPDRIGGTPVAIVSLIVEACGQYLLWLAPGPFAALLGALLTGLGCSMVYPSMGLEAVKRVPPQLRGTAVGGFAAFQDLAYGATGPLAGLLAVHTGYAPVFLIGGIAATLGLGMAILTRNVVTPRTNTRGEPMRDLGGKAAFVTGGASGIGFALGQAFAEAGMKVMLADIEKDALASAVETLRDWGGDVRGVACDVADADSVERAGKAAFEAFGHVHVVCNNAGVGDGAGIDTILLDNWRWVIEVNLMGVLHGIRTFLPHIRGHGEGGHIVNTASMAGMNSGLGFSAYSASKFAVVNMSEGLSKQLEPLGIGVTVLCPGFVRTRIMESGRNRPERYGSARMPDPDSADGKLLAQLIELGQAGLDPRDVAAQVITAIREDELYVFTHPDGEWRAEVEERFTAILAAMDKAARRLEADRLGLVS